MLFCYTTGIVFAVERMKNKRPSFKLFWQNQRRQELVICYFGGDLMSDIPHLNESDFLSIMKFFNPFAVNSSHMQHGS